MAQGVGAYLLLGLSQQTECLGFRVDFWSQFYDIIASRAYAALGSGANGVSLAFDCGLWVSICINVKLMFFRLSTQPMLQPLGFVLAAAAFGVNGQVLVKSPSRCPAGWLCQITKSNLDHKTPNRKQTVDPCIPERGLQRVFVSGGFEPLRCWAY